MCGICGVAFADPQRPVDREMLRCMTEIVRHRGPDSRGFHSEPGIGLGVQRLSINDLETGDQPISSEDRAVAVICNGEIYNFVELRRELEAAGHRFRTRSDVEVVVHLYEEHGVDCVHRLRGMFAFALWDAPRRRLMLARDRLGIKPLHYAIGKDGCYFGSELKSILVADRIERRIDPQALKDLFSVGFVMTPKTLLTGIRKLRPGHYLLYRDGTATLHRYWELDPSASRPEGRSPNPREWPEALLDKLREAVRIHLRSDVPVGAWLSPGIDSSSIVSLMTQLGRHPVPTFTLAFENPDVDEVRRQRTLDRFGGYALSPHRVVCRDGDLELFPKALWHREEPSMYGVEVPRMLLSEAAARGVKVVLTGEGSDELFGGYPWFRADRLLRPLAKLPLALRRLLAVTPVASRRWPGASRILLAPRQMNFARYRALIAPLEPDLPYLFSSDMARLLARPADSDGEIDRPPDFEMWHPFAQLRYYEMKVRLLDYNLEELDRASMAYSLETRVPFLDHELVEFCAGIPAPLIARGPREKYLLRQAMRGLLPPEIAERRKRALAPPTAQWLRGRLPDFAAELLSRDSLADRGYFNPDCVVRVLEDHRAGLGDYRGYLLGVLGVQLWDDLFMRGCRPAREA